MKQIGGTIGIFHRNRYDDTAQQRATRQKTSSRQTKLNHMKRVFFLSFLYFLECWSTSLVVFSVSVHLPIATENLSCQMFLPALLNDMNVFLPVISSALLTESYWPPTALWNEKQIQYVPASGKDYITQQRQRTHSASPTVVREG